MKKILYPILLATALFVGCSNPTPPPVPPPEEHTHGLYEEQLRTLDVQYQLLFEDVAALRAEFYQHIDEPNIKVEVEWPYKYERVLERIGQLECAVWGDKPCGVQ